MNKKKLKEFEKRLIEERNKITKKLDSDKIEFGDLNKSETGDVVDVAFNMYEKDRAIDVTEKEKLILTEINNAITRVQSGKFGLCSCGNEIQENRLHAIPWSRVCMDCVKKNKVQRG